MAGVSFAEKGPASKMHKLKTVIGLVLIAFALYGLFILVTEISSCLGPIIPDSGLQSGSGNSSSNSCETEVYLPGLILLAAGIALFVFGAKSVSFGKLLAGPGEPDSKK